MDITYSPGMTILGFPITSTVAQSGNVSWSRVTGKITALARDVYGRDLCLKQSIQYVHTFLLAKIRHTAQIFSALKEHERHLATAISWYIWNGAILRVPLSTLQRRTENGGLDLIDIATKCRALFLTRVWVQAERDGLLTAAWLHVWDVLAPRKIPPHIRVIQRNLEYLRIYALEWAYLEPLRQDEKHRAFKRRVYGTLRIMVTVETKPREVGVMQLQPEFQWARVWSNLHNTRTSDGGRSAWYMVIHGVLPHEYQAA
jgi:hypothetical protein